MKFKTLLEAVAHYAQATPNKICLIESESGRQFTYIEFWKFIVAFSHRLKSNGLIKGQHVVVRVGRLMETFVAQFAIYLAGGVYCPLEHNIKELHLLEMMEYLDSEFLISNESVAFDGKFIDLATVCVGAPENAPETELHFPDEEDLCAIVFTTGTTGRAKGVMLSYKAIMVFPNANRETYGIMKDDVFLWVHPLDRVGGLRNFGVPFLEGATAVYHNRLVFINDFFLAIGRYGVTILNMSAFSLSLLLKTAPDKFVDYADQLRVVAFGGGFMTENHKQKLKSLLPKTRLFVVYAATEVSYISNFEINRYSEKPGCTGIPCSYTKVYMIDEEGNIVQNTSKDKLGIVACESEGTMMGYWKAPDLTAEVLKNGRIIMTDVGYQDEDGFLYVMGRKDDVIVTGGHKVAPYEIEDVAIQIPGIQECVCVGATNSILDKVPKLFVVMEEGYRFSEKEISEYLSVRLETYKLPRIITQIDTLPKVSGSQKIDRKALVKHEEV